MIKAIFFSIILIYASLYDFKHRIVPTHVHVLIILTGLLNVSLLNFVGALLCFAVVLTATLIQRENSIGGGDVKLCAGIGFCMGIEGLAAIVLAMILGIITQSIIWKIKGSKSSFPLVPYLCIGCIIYQLIKFGGTYL